MTAGTGTGLYIHIPFCQAKCSYCGFNSYAGLEGLFEAYTTALLREIQLGRAAPVRTVYMGGGTPTVLPLSHLARILETTRQAFTLDMNAEVTIEANPGTVDVAMLSGLRVLGFNRLSLGVQSLENRDLRMLGRIHTAAEAVEAFQAARQAGFDNVSLDLIYGLPRQSLASWQAMLERALSLDPDHLSLYALSIEEGTPLAAAIARGEQPEPDPDLAADMYESAEELLSATGYLHYEISNWARHADRQCQHNLTYWRNEPYLGVGAGAHSWLDGRRWADVNSPEEYARCMLEGMQQIASVEEITPDLEMSETMIMGLRLVDEGVALDRFRERFGTDLRCHFAEELQELAEMGLIEIDDERVKLSGRGRLLGNQVFLRFLPG